MLRPLPRSTRTDTLMPSSTLCRSSAPGPGWRAAPRRRRARAPATGRSRRCEAGAEQLPCAVFLRRVEEILRRALLADPAAVEEADAEIGRAHSELQSLMRIS